MAEQLVAMNKSDVAVSKTFSAKFWVILMMSACGCYMAIHKIPIDSQFATLWGVVVTSYFARSEMMAVKKPEERPDATTPPTA